MVLPILLYCCEIWGYESIHIDCMRHIIPAKISTPLFMIYGELVRMPLKLIINQRIIRFWARLISGKHRKLSYLLYELIYIYIYIYIYTDSCTIGLNNTETILNNLGMSNVVVFYHVLFHQ